MKGKKWIWAIFILPSVFCLAFYFFVIRYPLTKSGNPIFRKLNYYGKKTLLNKDTLYFKVSLANANTLQGEIFDDSFLSKNFCVYSFVDFTDDMTTPRVLAQLYAALDKINHLKNTLFVSVNIHSTDLWKEELNFLSKKVHAPQNKWLFVNYENTQDVLCSNFWHFNDTLTCDLNELKHTLFLVDLDHHIRGIYDATFVEDVKRMTDEAFVLDSEFRYRKKHEKNNGK